MERLRECEKEHIPITLFKRSAPDPGLYSLVDLYPVVSQVGSDTYAILQLLTPLFCMYGLWDD